MVESNAIKFNEDELFAPEWLNTDFFEPLLQKSFNDKSIKVFKYVIEPGSKRGDHYASVMFRGIINFYSLTLKNQEKSLIIKTMPFVDSPKKNILEGMNVFDIEIKMYNEVIPKFQKILEEIGDSTKIGAKCLHASLKPHPVLVFEDLTRLNYKTVSNWGGDYQLALKAVVKLAKWHAISFKLVNDGDQSFFGFKDNAFTNEKFFDIPFYKYGYKDFYQLLERDPELSKYAPYFQHLADKNPAKHIQKLFKAFPNEEKAHIFVLNHGDFHIKNLMFLGKDQGDVFLVDYQLSIYGPAVIDLMYMLYMMVDNDSRILKRNEIIYKYFTVFTETLQKLEFDGAYPKLTDLYKDLLTFKDFELMLLTTMLTFTTAIQDEPNIDMDEAMYNQGLRESFYRNKKYVNYVKRMMPILLYGGYLE